jgi:hypothetical protein
MCGYRRKMVNTNANIYENDNAASEEEEFLTIPPTTVLEADGMKKIAEAEANEQARRGLKLQEIRFNDGDSKIVRIDPTKTEYKEDVFRREGEPDNKQWRYHFMASEYMMGRWTKFKLMRFSPTWGRMIIDNMKDGALTLKITRRGSTQQETRYTIIPTTNVK